MDLRNKEVTSLIFESVLRDIKNKKRGMSSLTSFFNK